MRAMSPHPVQGVVLTLLGVQFLTTGLLGEMLTCKNFSRGESYSICEKLE